MSTTYKLTYDPSDAKRGFELLAQAIRLAQQAGATLPPELQQIAQTLDQVEREETQTAKASDHLTKEMVDLAKSTDLAEDQLKSFSTTTDQAGRASAATAAKVDAKGRAIERVGKVVGGSREGLEKLTGAASALGSESAAVTKGMGVLAGVLSAVTSPLGAVVAIGASAISIFNSLQKGATGVADAMDPIDGFALDLSRSLGLITEEAARLSEIMKADTATEDFARRMKESEKAAIDLSNRVRDLRKTIEEGRADQQSALELQNATDPAELERKADALLAEAEALQQAGKISVEQVERYQKAIQQLEARRSQLLDEQRAKEKELAAEQRATAAERWQRMEEFHEQELRNAEERAEQERQLAKEQEQRDKDALKAKLDQLNELGKKREDQQQAANRPQDAGGPTSQAGPTEQNPYAAVMDPLNNILNQFESRMDQMPGGDGNAGDEAVTPDDAAKQIVDKVSQATDKIAEALARQRGLENLKGIKGGLTGSDFNTEEEFINKDGDSRAARARNRRTLDRQAKQERDQAARDVRSDLADGSADNEDVAGTIKKMVDEQIEGGKDSRGVTKELTDVLKLSADAYQDTKRENAALKQDLAGVKEVLRRVLGSGNQRQPFPANNPRRMGG